jgi:hydroxyacylglutathione hydrolase
MFSVTALSAFSDNYIWLICNQEVALVVDPGDSRPVIHAIDRFGLRLLAILNTHHHADHVGGNRHLRQRYGCAVYGPESETIPDLTHPLKGDEQITFHDLDLTFQIIATPGHTRGHISYYGAGYLFCGDTLFGCGCGRLFEGTAEQMHHSLSLLCCLPDHTLICCAHEYTLSNIRFARTVDKDNPDLIARERVDIKKREQGLPTLPSSLMLEKMTNPFLRSDQPAVIKAAEDLAGRSPLNEGEVFASIRAAKDRFQG